MLLNKIFLTYFLSYIIRVNCEGKFDITLRRMDCLEIDKKHIFNLTCSIKAVRGKKGIMNLYWVYKDVPNALCSFKIFYRNTNGRYMPYIVDVTVDFCKMNTKDNKLMAILGKLYIDHMPSLQNGCPINGYNDWMNWDINEHISELFPPIIPEGDFRIVQRMFAYDNHTYILLKYNLFVKSTGVMKMTMLNMGK